MNEIKRIGFIIFMLWSMGNMLLAQKEVKITEEKEHEIQTSENYFYGTGWDESNKENAIELALEELKIKLGDENQIKNHKIAKLECDGGGYFYMVFVEKNAKENLPNQEKVDIEPSLVDTAHTIEGVPEEINDLSKTRQWPEFITKFNRYNRQNKLWRSNYKQDMSNVGNCYVAIFKGEKIEAFLDKGASTRRDLISGKTIQNFETQYNNNYKIIWIELIEQ